MNSTESVIPHFSFEFDTEFLVEPLEKDLVLPDLVRRA